MQDDDIDDLLALAARYRPEAPRPLLDRVLADALAAQPQPRPVPPARPAARRAAALARLAALVGGRAALAGALSSVVLGLAIGYLNPAAADYLTGALTAADTLDLFPAADFLTVEG
jgi:hypothetical protein